MEIHMKKSKKGVLIYDLNVLGYNFTGYYLWYIYIILFISYIYIILFYLSNSLWTGDVFVLKKNPLTPDIVLAINSALNV